MFVPCELLISPGELDINIFAFGVIQENSLHIPTVAQIQACPTLFVCVATLSTSFGNLYTYLASVFDNNLSLNHIQEE